MNTNSYASEARTYRLVLLGLLALTALTVTAANVHFRNELFNVGAALGIATVKASLVALFFMHLRHDKPVNALVFLTGLAFLAVLLTLTLVDVDSRLPVQPTATQAAAWPSTNS
jgi:cytochrome c oxidase subunit 4